MAPLKDRLDSASTSSSSSPYQYFKITENFDSIMLYFDDAISSNSSSTPPPSASSPVPTSHSPTATPDGLSEFGYLRSHMQGLFSGLLTRPDLIFEAMIPTATLMEKISGFKKPTGAVVPVDVYVYGPREAATDIGRRLSSKNLFLQRPGCSRLGFWYENPQVLTFDDMED